MRSCPNFKFRTLNYLGCKLRLLDFIEAHVSGVTPAGAGVCDLFAGSGCVAYKLSSQFNVTACDIQNYTKVLCNALLSRPTSSKSDIDSFIARTVHESSRLREAFSPLIIKEEQAIANGDLETLAATIEFGSVEVFRQERGESPIADAQREVLSRLSAEGISGSTSFISRHYGGVYFSYAQATIIDDILTAIRSRPSFADSDLLLAALLSTASGMADTVGKHFAQPIKPRDRNGRIKPIVYSKAARDKTVDALKSYKEWLHKYHELPRGELRHSVMQGDYMQCLETLSDDVKTVYADPPYTREHYSRYYHVLETIALGDEPEMATVTAHGTTRVSNGLYRKNRHQSPFCIKSEAPLAFNRMFDNIARAHRNLLLSYSPYDNTKKSHPRVVTMKDLVEWAESYFPHVEVVSAGRFFHSKLNSARHFLESSNEAELLIVCTGA